MEDRETYEPNVMWRLGDPWRDFEEDIEGAAGPVTVVTKHGTARILGPRGQQRIPLEGGHVMALDLVMQPLARVDATPCGVSTLDGLGGWHKTARVILLLRGEHPRWLLSELGRQVFMEVRTKGWAVEGHPDAPCGALHCIRLG